MMKRILALALVTVTLVLTLTGCAFRYDKEDMSQYLESGVKLNEIVKLLETIEIEDSDFGKYVRGDSSRDNKVLEEIDSILAGKIKDDKGNALKDDAVYALRQKIFYAYYTTVEKDGKTVVIHMTNSDAAMQSMSDKKLQSFLSNPVYTGDGKVSEDLADATELQKKIFAALNGLKVSDYAYVSKTGTEDKDKLVKDQTVFADYTYTYKDPVTTKSVTVTGTYALLIVDELPQAGATKIEQLLAGEKVGEIKGTDTKKLEFTTLMKNAEKEDVEVKCTVSSLKVHFVADGRSLEVNDTLTADVSTAKNVYNGETVELKKNDVVTYHVFPAYAIAVNERNVTSILELLFDRDTLLNKDKSFTAPSLSCFTTNEKLKKIVDDLSRAKTTFNDVSKGTDSAKKTEAETALKKLIDALPEEVQKISGADAFIMDEYVESIYTDLEEEYDEEILKKIATEIWKEIILKNVKVDEKKLPKSAVKEAKERIIAGHKYTYNTGSYTSSSSSSSSSTTSIPYVDKYKNFDDYLQKDVYPEKDVEKEIETKAQAQVVEMIQLYAIAQEYAKLGKIDKVTVTNADLSLYVNEIYSRVWWNAWENGYPSVQDVRDYYGDSALRCALVSDRLFGHLLETKRVSNTTGKDLPSNASDAQIANSHVEYVNIKIKYTAPKA